MKKIFLLLFFVLGFFILNAQTDNPFKKAISTTNSKQKKIELLDSVVRKNKKHKLYSKYINMLINWSLEEGDIKKATFNTLRVSQYYMTNNYQDSALVVLNRMIDKKDLIKEPKDLANLYLKKGGAYYGNEDYVAIDNYTKAIEIYETINDTLYRADALLFRSNMYEQSAQFSNAIFDLNKSEELYRKGKDTTYILFSLVRKIDLFHKMGFEDKIKKETQKVLKLASIKPIPISLFYANTLLVNYYSKKGDLKKMFDYVQEANIAFEQISIDLPEYYATQFDFWKLNCSYYIKTGNLNKALGYLNQIEEKDIYTRNGTFFSDFLTLKSKYKNATGELKEAIRLAKQSLKISEDINDVVNITSQKKYIYELLTKNNKHKEASNYINEHLILQDSLYTLSKTNSFLYLQTLYETEKKEKEIAQQKSDITLLENENLIKNRKLINAIAFLIIISLISVFSFLYFRTRSKSLKRKSKLNELELKNQRIYADKLEKEKKITALELELKQKELTTNAAILLQKNEQYSALIENLEKIKSQTNNINIVKLLNNVISDCKSSNLSFNWDTFIATFENVHTNFYNDLLKKHPNLSPNEKKICAFLKLGMNTKDIASITNKIERTVVISRSRLRKKLQLEKTVDLANYITSF